MSKKETVILTLNDEALKIILKQKRTCLSCFQHEFIDRKYFRKVCLLQKRSRIEFIAAFLQQIATGHHDVAEMATYYINREFLSCCGFAKQKV